MWSRLLHCHDAAVMKFVMIRKFVMNLRPVRRIGLAIFVLKKWRQVIIMGHVNIITEEKNHGSGSLLFRAEQLISRVF